MANHFSSPCHIVTYCAGRTIQVGERNPVSPDTELKFHMSHGTVFGGSKSTFEPTLRGSGVNRAGAAKPRLPNRARSSRRNPVDFGKGRAEGAHRHELSRYLRPLGGTRYPPNGDGG